MVKGMLKMKKIIAVSLLTASFCITAKAAENNNLLQCSVDIKNDIVTVTGDFLAVNSNADCNVLILNPGYSAEDLPDAAFKGIQKQAEVKLNDKGILEMKFPVNEQDISQSGFCMVYVRLQNASELAEEVLESSFFYATDTDIEKAIRDLNKCRALTDAEVETKIEQYKNILSYSFMPYEAIDKTALAKALKESTTPQFSETDFSQVQSWIKTQSIIEALNQGKADTVFSADTILYDEYTTLSKVDTEKNVSVYNLYTASLNNTGKENVRKAITGKALKNTEDLKKEFAKAVVVEAVRNNAQGGYGHISSVLKTNAEYVGLDLSKYQSNSTADKSILNAKATSISALQSAINNSASNGGGNSGGGGGASSSGGRESSGVSFVPEGKNDAVISELDIYKTKYGIIDMENTKWAAEAVDALIAKGIVSKSDDNCFRPNDSITREEFVKLAVLAFGITADGEKTGFYDVAESDWSFSYIYTAKNAGIINGLSDGYFGKKERLSRQDMAVILKRCCDYKERVLSETVSEITFTDNADISDYAQEAVRSLTKSGIINGMDDGSFRPLEECTRAQCAKVIYLMIKE